MKLQTKLTIATAAVVACSVLLGCRRPTANLEDALFKAGVQCAINVHLKHEREQLLRGERLTVLGVEEWEAAARRTWIAQNPGTGVKAP
jgi:hypothetical protein